MRIVVPDTGSVQCGDPGTPLHATRAVYGTRDGMRVKYMCEEGYTLQGEACRECSTSGVWSPGMPSCESECLPVLANMEVRIETNNIPAFESKGGWNYMHGIPHCLKLHTGKNHDNSAPWVHDTLLFDVSTKSNWPYRVLVLVHLKPCNITSQ